MSGVTVDTSQLRKCANYLAYDAADATGGTGTDDASSFITSGKEAVSGVMVPKTAPADSANLAYDLPTGASADVKTMWIPYNHGTISSDFYKDLATAMAARDTAANAVKQACQDLAAALRKAAQMYDYQDQANKDQLDANNIAQENYEDAQQKAQDDYEQNKRDYEDGQ